MEKSAEAVMLSRSKDGVTLYGSREYLGEMMWRESIPIIDKDWKHAICLAALEVAELIRKAA